MSYARNIDLLMIWAHRYSDDYTPEEVINMLFTDYNEEDSDTLEGVQRLPFRDVDRMDFYMEIIKDAGATNSAKLHDADGGFGEDDDRYVPAPNNRNFWLYRNKYRLRSQTVQRICLDYLRHLKRAF